MAKPAQGGNRPHSQSAALFNAPPKQAQNWVVGNDAPRSPQAAPRVAQNAAREAAVTPASAAENNRHEAMLQTREAAPPIQSPQSPQTAQPEIGRAHV